MTERFRHFVRSTVRIAENEYVVSITGGIIAGGGTGAATRGFVG